MSDVGWDSGACRCAEENVYYLGVMHDCWNSFWPMCTCACEAHEHGIMGDPGWVGAQETQSECVVSTTE